MTTLAELAQAVSISSTRTDATSHRVTLRYRGRWMKVDYRSGAALTGKPSAEQVLEHLLGDADTYLNASDFADWAGEYGYDEDSPVALTTYKAMGEQTKRLQHLLGDDFGWFITADES